VRERPYRRRPFWTALRLLLGASIERRGTVPATVTTIDRDQREGARGRIDEPDLGRRFVGDRSVHALVLLAVGERYPAQAWRPSVTRSRRRLSR
jgi:hypothetical protein